MCAIGCKLAFCSPLIIPLPFACTVLRTAMSRVLSNRYAGAWANGRKHGAGVLYDGEDGTLYRGEWLNDVMNGLMVRVHLESINPHHHHHHMPRVTDE